MEFLNHNHHTAILMLTAGRSTKEISVELGVSQRTIDVWKSDPNFASLLRESSNKAFEASHAELMLHTQKAVFQLQQILDNPDTTTRIRLSAIQLMLQYGLKSTKDTIIAKLESVKTEEIVDYFIQNGDSEQIFKALEFKRKTEELENKYKNKITLIEFEEFISLIVKKACNYIDDPISIKCLIEELDKILNQANQKSKAN